MTIEMKEEAHYKPGYISVDNKDMENFVTFDWPQNQSELVINQNMIVGFQTKKPNWWRRMWYWFLLGWKWRDV